MLKKSGGNPIGTPQEINLITESVRKTGYFHDDKKASSTEITDTMIRRS